MAERPVAALDAVIGELPGQPVMRGVRLRDDEEARGVLVDPVDDPGALFAADAGEFAPEMVEQRIDQRSGRRSRGRVHDNARRFIDDDKVVVLVEDLEGDVLRDRDLGVRYNRTVERDGSVGQKPGQP